MNLVKAVIFDLGDTLMHGIHPWPGVLARADRAVADYILAQGIQINPDDFHHQLEQQLDEYYSQREASLQETSTAAVLQELLEQAGHPSPPKQLIRGALNARYTISQANWQLEEDALPTLDALQTRDLRIGLISNAGDNQDVFELVEKFKIEPYLDFVLTSAACGFRKPHPQIFELALAHWGFPPPQVVMVGDRLDADVQGAQLAGMRGIWLTRRSKSRPTDPPQPDGVIDSLYELISWLDKHSQQQ